MTTHEPTPSHHASEAWAGAFLLVIPGAALVGAGVGMLTDHLLPYALIGSGAGCVLWGMVAALRKG